MMALRADHQRAHRAAPSRDLAPLVLVAGCQQLRLRSARSRASGIRTLALYPALFVRLVGRAELTADAPVRTKGDEARGSRDESHARSSSRSFQVVVSLERALEIIEGVFVSFEECLLVTSMIRAMECGLARHAAHSPRISARLSP
jgi:hypothetical protein